jgi:hypothetical protein
MQIGHTFRIGGEIMCKMDLVSPQIHLLLQVYDVVSPPHGQVAPTLTFELY